NFAAALSDQVRRGRDGGLMLVGQVQRDQDFREHGGSLGSRTGSPYYRQLRCRRVQLHRTRERPTTDRLNRTSMQGRSANSPGRPLCGQARPCAVPVRRVSLPHTACSSSQLRAAFRGPNCNLLIVFCLAPDYSTSGMPLARFLLVVPFLPVLGVTKGGNVQPEVKQGP